MEDLTGRGNHLVPAGGGCLRTAADARLNGAAFGRGYTIEAYAKLPATALRDHARMGVLSRPGAGADPLAVLDVADGLALRWAAVPLHRDAAGTSWSHELPVERWFHAAVVNDGSTTTMYVDGEPVLRNPRSPAVGLASAGRPWLVGASCRDGAPADPFLGALGMVRIVDRPLGRSEFLV